MSRDWMKDAACRGVDPELFFPHTEGNPMPAIRVCRGCTVADACLEYALDTKAGFGVWGAMLMQERSNRPPKKVSSEHVAPRAQKHRPKKISNSGTCRDCGAWTVSVNVGRPPAGASRYGGQGRCEPCYKRAQRAEKAVTS